MSTAPAESLRFIHLSDPQLIPAGEMNYDINPQLRIRQCIDAILSDCASLPLDFAVITGDLTHWGEEVAYKVLREELSRLPFPVYMLMGNHDHREAFSTVFPEHPTDDNSGFVQYVLDSAAGRMIFLDTLDAGKRSGVLCQQRLQWLERKLADSEGQPVYLFMHHPPFTVGLSVMDDDNLVNSDEFLKIVNPYRTQIRHIFFGHLHRTVTGSWHGISYSCPLSPVHQTAFEFDNKKPAYVSPEPPAYHLVELKPEQVVVHSRLFLHSEPAIDSRSCYRYQLHDQSNNE
ncbi:phosphodiesterase [Endozoicomonas euniceicola]|uniref:Phosphodiesterase n=1 Tax=Endozoicomonas euniceicola TaxID=1234143 RepID=A0ABY6GMC1_9GAMM|nr:phosphodiesterase [Endozoicomonas euniceicola]UYM13863.1 phosphodiesterase [Endozoicomonas euniceicola]